MVSVYLKHFLVAILVLKMCFIDKSLRAKTLKANKTLTKVALERLRVVLFTEAQLKRYQTRQLGNGERRQSQGVIRTAGLSVG